MIFQRKSPAELKLPLNASFHCDPLPDGIAYVFRHTELGELGRLCVTGTASGEACVVSLLNGLLRWDAVFHAIRRSNWPMGRRLSPHDPFARSYA